MNADSVWGYSLGWGSGHILKIGAGIIDSYWGIRIHGHKLNTDSVGGYRLRWGLGSQTKMGVGITD